MCAGMICFVAHSRLILVWIATQKDDEVVDAEFKEVHALTENPPKTETARPAAGDRRLAPDRPHHGEREPP